ncbi:MAG: type II toxin-antitoxin system RelE/ParE family toxin [Synergistaceae bacterium]|nr:type II toxin-antitoxin system RelE/ParE family toxin [Synergistaceae bacterium]
MAVKLESSKFSHSEVEKPSKDPDVKKLYNGNNIKKWAAIRRQAEKRLRVLDAADRLETLTLLPSNQFEALRGNRNGQYSIRINDKWRICFTWPLDTDWLNLQMSYELDLALVDNGSRLAEIVPLSEIAAIT